MRVRGLLMIATALLWSGCGVDEQIKPDSSSGKDFERAGAQELFLDKLTDDFLDADTGDNTDWKYFKIKDKGILTLTVYWDEKNIGSIIDVRDRFGVLLDSRRHSPELEKDILELKVEPGTHFVRLYAESGQSVYTIEGLFQNFDHTPDDDVRPVAVGVGQDLLDDPFAQAQKAPEPRPRARRRRGGTRPAVRPTRAPDEAAGRKVTATITRLIPGAGGKGTMLTLNRGSAHGLKQNDTGAILDDDGSPLPGGSLRVTEVGEKFSKARTDMKQGNIAHRRRVVVYVQ